LAFASRLITRSARVQLTELVPNEGKHVVGIGIAPEHRLLEDEVAVDVDVEDPARAGHDLHGSDDVLELLKQPRRQTGGVRERPSGDAVLDPNVVPFGHECMLADARGLI
jgi:hypothetical protein